MQALTEIEARFPVSQWTVRSVAVWPLIRVRWALGEWSRHYVTSTSNGSSGKAAAWATRIVTGPTLTLRAQGSDGMRASWTPARRDLLFLSDGVSYGQLGGRWLERFCDPLIRAASARGLTTRLLCPAYALRTPRATPSLFIQPQLDRGNLRGALLARISRGDAHLPGINDVAVWAGAHGYGASSFDERVVVSDATRLVELSRVHARLLKRTQPRLAFVVSYYGIEGMAFVLACHRAGVRVVDLQHGVQGQLHPAYASFPKPSGSVHALLPHRFWVWSDWERSIIEDWARGTGHRALAGGDPWMSVWEAERGWEGVREATARTDALVARAAGRPVVLIALQWGLNPGEQLEPMRRLIAAGQGRFQFWVRLHPAMLERREEIRAFLAAAGRQELDEPTDLPLPALLNGVTVQVTHSSSTAVEAARFGVATLITSPLGTELYARLVDAGWIVTETESTARMLDALGQLVARRRPVAQARVPLDETLDELLAEPAEAP